MPNTSKILIVDDDAELRDALTDQLSLYEEFEAVVAENGTKAVQTAKAVQIDLVIMGPARHRWARGGAHFAQERLQGSDHHADRPRRRFGRGSWPRIGRQRLRDQALSLCRAAQRVSAPSFASMKPAKMSLSPSALIRSGRNSSSC
jgi:DNA-binding NarL/FixJ family response regulator